MITKTSKNAARQKDMLVFVLNFQAQLKDLV